VGLRQAQPERRWSGLGYSLDAPSLFEHTKRQLDFLCLPLVAQPPIKDGADRWRAIMIRYSNVFYSFSVIFLLCESRVRS
ncbi:hypothetical protein, partial [Sphingobium sp. ba1]|uniref:hypothetical protein n=1 Tax=Sphingobium sp. ba1 TaxID=1522072 RepID=UPI001ED9BA48